MLTPELIVQKDSFLKELKSSLSPNTTDLVKLLNLYSKLTNLPGSSILLISPEGLSIPPIKVQEFALLDIDTKSWAPRFDFSCSLGSTDISEEMKWVQSCNNTSLEDVNSYKGRLEFLFHELDNDPLAVVHGVFPINLQYKSEFEKVTLESSSGEKISSGRMVSGSRYLSATFTYSDFEILYCKEEPFEFLKNTPLESLPDMMGHTRGGHFG